MIFDIKYNFPVIPFRFHWGIIILHESNKDGLVYPSMRNTKVISVTNCIFEGSTVGLFRKVMMTRA